MHLSDNLITDLDLGLAGRVYRSRMPLSQVYDPGGKLLDIFLDIGISTIVLLESEEKYQKVSGRDLKQVYAQSGFEVISFPIEDYHVPNIEELRKVVGDVEARASQGENIAIHCHAGIGRTGMFSACLAKRALGLSGDEALIWIDQIVPGAPETLEQKEIVRHF